MRGERSGALVEELLVFPPHDGLRLAGVGARLVGEVIIGLIELDQNSYLSQQRWRPTLPRRARETFDMVDLLTFAGVDPGKRGQ